LTYSIIETAHFLFLISCSIILICWFSYIETCCNATEWPVQSCIYH